MRFPRLILCIYVSLLFTACGGGDENYLLGVPANWSGVGQTSDVNGISLGGVIEGLDNGSVFSLVESNSGLTVRIENTGNFNFSQAFASGSEYSVSIVAQPSDQECQVTNASGTIGETNVTNISVVCENDGTDVIGSLDCLNLNPDKVYFHGTLQEGAAFLDVIADPDNPSTFCTGFSTYNTSGAISTSGTYIYEDHSGDSIFFAFVPDTFSFNSTTSQFTYPESPLDNDTSLYVNTATGCGVRTILLHPVTNSIFFSCPNDTIHTDAITPYYSLGNGDILGVTPEGSMLIEQGTNLILVHDDLTEEQLTLPESDITSPYFYTAKNYIHPDTGNESMWIVAFDGSSSSIIHRWSLDLINLEITDEGAYAAPLENITQYQYSTKINGNGELLMMGTLNETGFIDVIVKSPMASTEQSTTIIYSEENETEDQPYALIHISYLVTGS